MNLKVYLASIDMTMKAFANDLGVSYRLLWGISRGHTMPSRRLAKDIEEATMGIVKIAPSTKVKGRSKKTTTIIENW